LQRCTSGLGAMWLAAQHQGWAKTNNHTPIHSAENPLDELPPLSLGKAKRVIFLHMEGAPSQLELFDYKPELHRYDGKDCPEEFLKGQRFAFIQGTPKLLGPQFPFRQHGQCGAWVSDRLPHFSKIVDEVCFIKTMTTVQSCSGSVGGPHRIPPAGLP
jgi:hypothetical protein